MADETLWSVYQSGTDNIYAVRSRREAVEAALKINNALAEAIPSERYDDPNWPIAWASPKPWPYSPEDHSSEVKSLGDDPMEWPAG